MISIIIPIYNVSLYLTHCIRSVLEQTIKELEIILVNDGATDDSGQICQKYASMDERIIYVEKKNGGLSDARNAGIERAHGEYIAFIDGDDFIHPQMYEQLLWNITQNQADISVCDFYEILENETVNIEKYNVETDKYEEYAGQEVCKQLFTNNLQTVVAWNKLYRRELFLDIRYPVGVLHEDEYVIHKLLSVAKKTVYSTRKLYFYLQRGGSITAEIKPQNIWDGWNSLQERKQYWIDTNQIQWFDYTLVQELFFIVGKYDKMKRVIDKKQIKFFRNLFHDNLLNPEVLNVLGEGRQLSLFYLFDRSPFFYKKFLDNEKQIDNIKQIICGNKIEKK